MVVIRTIFPSLASSGVVEAPTSRVAIDGNFFKLTIFPYQWHAKLYVVRDTSSRWLHMPWRQIDAMSSATAMLSRLWLYCRMRYKQRDADYVTAINQTMLEKCREAGNHLVSLWLAGSPSCSDNTLWHDKVKWCVLFPYRWPAKELYVTVRSPCYDAWPRLAASHLFFGLPMLG